MAAHKLFWGLAGAVALAALTIALGSAQAATVHVELKDFAFSPQNVTINIGDTVMWTNNDTHDHDVTFEAGFDSGGAGSLKPGDSFNHTFLAAGEFRYRCTLHSSNFTEFMVGRVTVDAPAGGNVFYVQLKNAQFDPAEVHVEAGDTVIWINNDSFGHDVHFEAGFNSGAPGGMTPGATYSHTFDTNGTFRYRCDVHSSSYDAGMVGKVVVGTVQGPEPQQPSPGFEGALVALSLVGAAAVLAAWRRRRA